MERDSVKMLEANIDDMSPQVYEYLLEKLLTSGALDAHLENIIMKKGRPAIKLSVICREEDAEKLAKIIFKETSTIGLRILDAERLKLPRKSAVVKTKFGPIPVKVSGSQGILTLTPEYEECKAIAEKTGVPLRDVIDEARGKARGKC